MGHAVSVMLRCGRERNVFKEEVHDFYKTSWFIEFEALGRMLEIRGLCDKPFKRYSRLKKEYF